MIRGFGRMMGGGGPFAGIPPEMQDKVEAILHKEPDHPDPDVIFEHTAPDVRTFTLRRFLRPHAPAIALAFLLVGIETLASQAGPLLTKIAIDSGIGNGRFDVILTVAGFYLAAVLVHVVVTSARISWTGRVGERLTYLLRERVFTHLQRLSMDYFTREKAGRILTRMTSDIEALTALFQEGLVNFAIQLLTVFVVAAILFSMNAVLAGITIGIVVPLMLVLTLWFRSASDRGYTAVRERIADVLTDLQESLSGARIVVAHNRQEHNTLRHRAIVGEYRNATLYTGKVGAIYGPSTEAVGLAGQAFIVLVGGRMVLNDTLTIGQLAAFVLYLTAFFAPILQLVQLYNTYQSGKAAVLKLRELLSAEPAVTEAADAVDLPPVSGEIVLEAVGFGYDPARPVLSDVDLRIQPGETFALVGPTGAGKSTIAKLIARFYDPVQGRVLIDGHDLRSIGLTSLRRQVGNVPQEPFLFADTIRANIAFGHPEATDDEILDACRQVGVMDLVDRLPNSLDTEVRERGVSLSAGERQLLALARAFLAKPRVLILDEATSSLDLQLESQIEHALDVLLEGRTAVVIAHRLSTAMRADRVAVVEDGRIIEIGAHAELVALGGRYASMYETWMAHADPMAGQAHQK